MKINGWDIAQADARQWNVTPGFHTVKNDSEWVQGSPVPVMMRNEIGFKPLTVRLLIKRDGGRQAILNRCGEILSHLLEPVELELDDFEHNFSGILKKHSHKEEAIWRFHVLTLEFDCYEHSRLYTAYKYSDRQSFIAANPGNIVTPAIVTITPQISISEITVSGVCRDAVTGADLPIQISNAEANKKVVINGETGLVTQDKELKEDVEFWGFPTLLPGNNEITVSSNRAEIMVEFRPQYM